MMARKQTPAAQHRPRPQWTVWLAAVWMIPGHMTGTFAAPTSKSISARPAPVCHADRSDAGAAPRGFLGFACRDSRCGSHKAGFDWAERNEVKDARSCQARNDVAFTEGCRVFASETVTPEQAGFQWARDNGLTEPCLCAGAGPRFEAGCEAFVRGFAD